MAASGDVYRELGVEPVINAAGSLTSYGGSLMPAAVVEAMAAASRAFVDMEALHHAAGQRIAALIGVEAAHICSCASAGMAVMAAACITTRAGTAPLDRGRALRLPTVGDAPYRFVSFRDQRNPFAQALRLTGAELLEIDATPEALRAALAAERVAGALYTVAWFTAGMGLPLEETCRLAHEAGLPVIVDAAAEVPPLENLTRFLEEGADLVTFSGGKSLRGPQASGLILGRADLVEACRQNDSPNMGVGRPMKVGKEEIIALTKAVELYVSKDHAAEMQLWERQVAHILEALADLPGVHAWRQMPEGVGQQIPHAAVTWDEDLLGLTPGEAVAALRQGQPPIVVQLLVPATLPVPREGPTELRVHPHTLEEGQEAIVAQRLREVLAGV